MQLTMTIAEKQFQEQSKLKPIVLTPDQALGLSVVMVFLGDNENAEINHLKWEIIKLKDGFLAVGEDPKITTEHLAAKAFFFPFDAELDTPPIAWYECRHCDAFFPELVYERLCAECKANDD